MSIGQRIRTFIARRRGLRFSTLFGTAYVYETVWSGVRIRVLDIGDAHQSATFLDEDWCYPAFPYISLYDCLYDAGTDLASVCMLGGGGYSYPKHVIAHHPESRIDVVEIDPAITAIAREHFFLDRLQAEYDTRATNRLGLIQADGLDYLRSCAQQGICYDAVLNDCFTGRKPYHALATSSAARLVKACLAPGGMYASNVIASLEGPDSGPLWELAGTLSTYFCHVLARPSKGQDADETNNMLVIATDAAVDIPHTLPLVDAS